MNNVIYSYYHKLPHGWIKESEHLCLISLWKQSWFDHGFNPIVLGEADAKKHNMYEDYKLFFEEMHKEITGSPLNSYGSACWLRWLAYATQPEEKFFVSDYDVINHNFKPTEIRTLEWLNSTTSLLFLDDNCPCLASGTPSQFERLCNHYMEFTKTNLQKIKEEYNRLDVSGVRMFNSYHDQDFLVIEELLKSVGAFYIKKRNRNVLSTPKMSNFWKAPLVHYGSYLCEYYMQHVFQNTFIKTREELVDYFLNKQHNII